MRQTVFEYGELVDSRLILDGKEYNVVLGKHEIWVPDLPGKIVWTHNGKIEAFKDWELGGNAVEIIQGTFNRSELWYDADTVNSIISEYKILKLMAENKMAPLVHEMFHIKNFVSNYPYGARHCDVKGRFGFYMESANLLPAGEFSKVKFNEKIAPVLKRHPSDGAVGDIYKLDNIQNGYCVDVRRTIWDMIEIDVTSSDLSRYGRFIRSQQSDNNLIADVKSVGQYPPKQRKTNYQSYFLKDQYIQGSRDTLSRLAVMKIPDSMMGVTAVDLGSQLGSMCFEMHRRGAVKITGFDSDIDYVKISRRIARANGMPINFLQMDLNNTADLSSFCEQYYGGKVGIVLALSLYKHIGTKMFDAIGALKWGECYVESNNCPSARRSKQAKEIEKGVGQISKNVEYLGETTDRSTRCVWVLRDKLIG